MRPPATLNANANANGNGNGNGNGRSPALCLAVVCGGAAPRCL